MNIILWILAVMAVGAFYSATSDMHLNDQLSTAARMAIQIMWLLAFMPEETIIKRHVLPAMATGVLSYLMGTVVTAFMHHMGLFISQEPDFDELMMGAVVLTFTYEHIFYFFQDLNNTYVDDHMA